MGKNQSRKIKIHTKNHKPFFGLWFLYNRDKIINPIFMQSQYSKKLIDRCKEVFEKKAGKKMTDEEAEIALDQLARLGMLAVNSFEKSSKLSEKKNKH